MPKDAKPSKPQKKYTDADIASFVEELESGTTDPVDDAAPVAPAAAEPEEVEEDAPMPEPKSAKKVRVQADAESSAKRKPMPDAPLPKELTSSVKSDMSKMTKAKRHFPWTPVLTIVALLAAVSVGGFFFFNQQKKFANAHVQVQFKPVADVTSGGPMTIVLQYQNLEPVDLTNAELNIIYPDGFTYTSATPTPTNDFHTSFSLGTIKTGQAGQVSIDGSLLGAIGEAADFSATLSYRPANFNSDFQQEATTTVTIGNSTLSLSIDGPTQLAPGSEGTWTLSYTNTSDQDLKDIQIAATYPDAFTLTSTKPTTTDHKTWTIASLKKGVSGVITLVGTVNGSIGDTLLFKATAGLTSAGADVQLQDEQSLLVLLIKTGVEVQAAVNGSTDPVTIQPGDTLNYSLQILNSSDVALQNVTVTAKIEGAPLDLTSLSNDKATVKDNTLTWSPTEIAGLSSFKPGQAATMSFSVGTKSTLPIAADSDEDQHVTLTVDVVSNAESTSSNSNVNTSSNSNTNSSSGAKLTQPSTVVVTKVATILGLTAEARYTDDANNVIGGGPVPPVVGSTTTYRIILKVTNTTSDASNLVVTAQLPNSVLWTGQHLSRDAGTLTFDPDTRTVQWTINTVPAGTGSRLPALAARFDVSITPTSEQVDTVPILVQSPSATATDAYSKVSLTASAASLTTDVPTDPVAAHKGTVVAK